MLIIRREQEEVLGIPALEAWIDRMTRFIADEYPKKFQSMGDAGTRALVLRAIAKGRAHHVETQGGVAVLIELMIQFGENFENSRDKRWADAILAHSTLPAALKLKLMYSRMTELSRGRVIVPFRPSGPAVSA